MVSSPVDHSHASGLSSPPIKIHNYANECATAQTYVAEKPDTGHAEITKHDCSDHVKDSSRELSNGYADENINGHTNGHANGSAKPQPNGHLDEHLEEHTSGHLDGYANSHANGHTNGHALNGYSKDPSPSKARTEKPTSVNKDKYRHIMAVHSQPRTSCLSHDSTASPSFLGFRNLMVLVLSA